MGVSAATEWSRGCILGRGSTATVFLASSSLASGGELFAVKSADIARSEFLQREQRIHSSIPDSPHIISYFGFDVKRELSQTYYNLLLEYAPGGSLIDDIKKNGGKLCEAQIRARTKDVMLGLAHLHSNGIAHCDVKGQNVLIGCDGRAKIADFGCAKFVHGDNNKGQFSGTPMFMAPEVARGEDQGMPADIWAAGCTIIEMATGMAPWPNATDAVSLLHRVAFSNDVPEVPTWLSDEGKDFLMKCLCREAEERWTAEELLEHPFLLMDSESNNKKWTSPKSTLDRSFWDSLASDSDEDEEEHHFDLDSVPNADIDELFGHGADNPNWTWDDDWVTVRIDDDHEIASLAVGDESPAPAGNTNSQVVTSSISISISITEKERPLLTSNHDVISDDNCYCKKPTVISSDNYSESIKQTMLCLSNWISSFNLISTCQFTFALC